MLIKSIFSPRVCWICVSFTRQMLSQVRKRPPEMSEGRILCVLSHKDLKSLVNQAVDALKYAQTNGPCHSMDNMGLSK